MEKAIIRMVTLCMAFALLLSTALAVQQSPADSATPRASLQLAQYGISISNVSRGTMRATFTIHGTHNQMSKIGAQEIVIEQEVSSGKWQETASFSGYYGYDCLFHMDSVTFSVQPGGNYRATLTAYAEDANGSDSGDITSGSLRAST